MPQLCHYTDDEGAEKIIRSGKVMASLASMASGDAAYGNGVYLTNLKPGTSTRTQIAQNNWMDTSTNSIKKTKNYFVFDIPISCVNDVSARGRSIFLFGGRNDLLLKKFPWWLKDFDTGVIIASYKYHIGSFGPASLLHGRKMGDYVMTEDTVNGRPVYKGPAPHRFLFMASNGSWNVGPDTGKDRGYLRQKNANSLGPDLVIPWEYFDPNLNLGSGCNWNGDDGTLRAHAWQM